MLVFITRWLAELSVKRTSDKSVANSQNERADPDFVFAMDVGLPGQCAWKPWLTRMFIRFACPVGSFAVIICLKIKQSAHSPCCRARSFVILP